SLRVWLATSPSRWLAFAATSQRVARAWETSAGAFPAGNARATMREKSPARLAHSITLGERGGGGTGGVAVVPSAAFLASQVVWLGSERWSFLSSSSRWCPSL